MPNKRAEKKKKEFEMVIFHATRRNIHRLVRKCQTKRFIIQLVFLCNFGYGATSMEKDFIQCDKIYLKSQYYESKALNLIPDHQRMLFRNSTPKLFNADIPGSRLGYVTKLKLYYKIIDKVE